MTAFQTSLLGQARGCCRGAGSGGSPCAPTLFIWAADVAWRKEQRNVELGSASCGSAQLKLRDCFLPFRYRRVSQGWGADSVRLRLVDSRAESKPLILRYPMGLKHVS